MRSVKWPPRNSCIPFVRSCTYELGRHLRSKISEPPPLPSKMESNSHGSDLDHCVILKGLGGCWNAELDEQKSSSSYFQIFLPSGISLQILLSCNNFQRLKTRVKRNFNSFSREHASTYINVTELNVKTDAHSP